MSETSEIFKFFEGFHLTSDDLALQKTKYDYNNTMFIFLNGHVLAKVMILGFLHSKKKSMWSQSISSDHKRAIQKTNESPHQTAHVGCWQVCRDSFIFTLG